jgi:hypothetical protein
MNKGRVGEERRGKEMDRCPLTVCPIGQSDLRHDQDHTDDVACPQFPHHHVNGHRRTVAPTPAMLWCHFTDVDALHTSPPLQSSETPQLLIIVTLGKLWNKFEESLMPRSKENKESLLRSHRTTKRVSMYINAKCKEYTIDPEF